MDPRELIAQCVEALKALPEMAYLRELMNKSQAQMDQPQAEQYEEKEIKEDDDGTGDAITEKDKVEEIEPAKLRMQFDQHRRKYAKLENEYKTLFAKVADLERKERVAGRRADLLGLEGEGYDFDLAEEVEMVADMELARYSKHLANIRKNYKKAPIGVHIQAAPISGEGGITAPLQTPEAVSEKALQLAFEKYNRRKP